MYPNRSLERIRCDVPQNNRPDLKGQNEFSPGGPPADKRKPFNLKPRLAWLVANDLLPKEVEALADAVREDANDGVI